MQHQGPRQLLSPRNCRISLFGGSGRVSSALLGTLIIASVENGMGLQGYAAGQRFVVTGLVLLVAVLVDSLSWRGRSSSGIG